MSQGFVALGAEAAAVAWSVRDGADRERGRRPR